MITLHIHTVGKHKADWLNQVLDIYTKRLRAHYDIVWHLHKKEAPFLESVQALTSWVYLSEKGLSITSEQFAKNLSCWIEAGGSSVHFVIGGDLGLPEEVAKGAHTRIALSPMTLTHQMCRALFLEQIYRAEQIRQGTPYHK